VIVVALVADAAPITGAPGAVAGGATGVTALDAAESAPVPTPLTARTTKLYAVPLVNPVTTVLVALPGRPVTVRTTVVPVRTTFW